MWVHQLLATFDIFICHCRLLVRSIEVPEVRHDAVNLPPEVVETLHLDVLGSASTWFNPYSSV